MKSTEHEAVRISGNIGRGVFNAIETFLSVMARKEFKNKSISQIAKELNNQSYGIEEIAYSNIENFYSDNIAKGIHQFDSIGMNLEKNQMSQFNQLAKQYGFKYAYEHKPRNIKELMNKSNLNEMEQFKLSSWTKLVNGERIEIDDDFKITFAIRDIPKLEHIMKEVKEYPIKNLDERIAQATDKQRRDLEHSLEQHKSVEAPEYGDR